MTTTRKAVPPSRAGQSPEFVVDQEYSRLHDIHLNYGGGAAEWNFTVGRLPSDLPLYGGLGREIWLPRRV